MRREPLNDWFAAFRLPQPESGAPMRALSQAPSAVWELLRLHARAARRGAT